MSQSSSDNKYFWSSKSSLTIDDFIKKFRPSIITDDLTPWIWVQGTSDDRKDPERESGHGEALTKAHAILEVLTSRIEEIETDESIPTRAKKGTKSKKQHRDEAHETATNDLRDLSLSSKWTVGKWLLFPQHADVDRVWALVAKSVASGPLKDAGVMLAKVAPTPESSAEGEERPHVVCLYMENVYDKELATRICETLLKSHGLEPSAAKSDLYTLAGIDSSHPSRLRSSIWRANEVIAGGNQAIIAMKEEFRKNKNRDSPGKKGEARSDGILETDSEDERIEQAVRKRKPAGESAQKSAPPEGKGRTMGTAGARDKRVKSAALKYQENDIFGGGSDSD